jgi:Na+-transporting methylmalonyl-CoA/oxaloacetate decarboxylase gamma subunit
LGFSPCNYHLTLTVMGLAHILSLLILLPTLFRVMGSHSNMVSQG